jgi:hypothetical protein
MRLSYHEDLIVFHQSQFRVEVDKGAIDVVVAAIIAFPYVDEIQLQGCLALEALCAREFNQVRTASL